MPCRHIEMELKSRRLKKILGELGNLSYTFSLQINIGFKSKPFVF